MIRFRTWSRSQLVCRAFVAGLPVVALFVASVRPGLPMVLLVVACSLVWAAFPELAIGSVVLVSVLAWWALRVPDLLQPGVLVAALALAGAHGAGLLAAYGPERAVIERPLIVMWVRRMLLAFVAAPVAYAAVVVLDDPVATVWPLAVGVLAVLALVLGLHLRAPSDPGAI